MATSLLLGEPETLIDEAHVHEDLLLTAEEYADLDVRPVKVPKLPHLNIHELTDRLRRDEYGRERVKDEHKQAVIAYLSQLSETEQAGLRHKWSYWARKNQIAPEGLWTFWWLLAGRGFGKTRSGGEWINERVEAGLAKRIALVAPTASDVRKTMVEGESGILAIAPPWNRPHWEPSKLQLTWPNGAVAGLFSAEEPERLRGPQFDTFWADEIAAWKKLRETWDMLMFGFRLGDDPRGCITTTPKPLELVKEAVTTEREEKEARVNAPSVVITKGSTYDNRGNLSPQFYKTVIKKYEGTRLGRQELDAEIIDDMPGALWQRKDIDEQRIPCNIPPVTSVYKPIEAYGAELEVADLSELKIRAAEITKACGEDLVRVCVNVDPNASNDEGSDEIGITVTAKGMSGRGYLLADLSMSGSPGEWATTAVLAHDLFMADRVIGEANNGGNMVEHTIASAAKDLKRTGHRSSDNVSIMLVHASRGKVTRAEPVSLKYEQKQISHVGSHKKLEDQMCLFTTDFDRAAMGFSPDRMDSLVWGFTHLFYETDGDGILEFYKQEHMSAQAKREGKGPAAELFPMSVPDGITQAHGLDGTRYDVKDGQVLVRSEDRKGLRGAGFKDI